jgi:putative transposase
VRDTLFHASERHVCRVLGVSRAAIRRRSTERAPTPRRLNPVLASRLEALIQRYPTFGYRRLCAWLRFREGLWITPKTVYRALALKGWFVHQRS